MGEKSLRRLEPDDTRPELICGDDDLDEYYRVDSIQGSKELMAVTYVLMEDGQACAFFSLSNDSIKREDVPRSAFDRIRNLVAREKRYSSMPAAKIGRLGVGTACQRCGYGTYILDYLKVWFTKGNKTGCRFLLVDAYNKPNITAFYKSNGFEYLSSSDENDNTRIMYFDLLIFRE